VERILVAITFGILWMNNFIRTRNLAIISMALNCGLRRGEILGLRLSDVDIGARRLTVRSETTKVRRERIIPMNARVRRDLQDYLDERQARGFMTTSLWVSETHDDPFTADGLRHTLKVICHESGIKFHLHQLRHTFAVNFLRNSGRNSHLLQALLGHRSIVSSAVYTRCLPPEMMRDDIEKLANLANTV
jgi:integrase